jgi:hypothetical protein
MVSRMARQTAGLAAVLPKKFTTIGVGMAACTASSVERRAGQRIRKHVHEP